MASNKNDDLNTITYVLELLKPTKKKQQLLLRNIKEVVNSRKAIVKELSQGNKKLSTADFPSINLPSAVKNQDIREVKALHKRFKKSNSKKEMIEFKSNQPICYNNQNYKIDGHIIEIPLYTHKSSRYAFPVKRNKRFDKLHGQIRKGAKLGKASLFYKRNKWFFAVTISFAVDEVGGNNTMGIDIGLRQLAVASVKTAKGHEINRQFHSGKQAGFIRKKHRSLRRKLGQSKKPKAIERINDKEQRWMADLNDKISRQLIDLAVQEKVSTIVMEDLKNIRHTARSYKSADRNLNSWAFYQLQQFIDYKAKLNGINVVYVKANYTSQRCSNCGEVVKSNRHKNLYTCNCGNHIHSDLNAARNIADKHLKGWAIRQQSA
jgi:IS605 OrfB family transposase